MNRITITGVTNHYPEVEVAGAQIGRGWIEICQSLLGHKYGLGEMPTGVRCEFAIVPMERIKALRDAEANYIDAPDGDPYWAALYALKDAALRILNELDKEQADGK